MSQRLEVDRPIKQQITSLDDESLLCSLEVAAIAKIMMAFDADHRIKLDRLRIESG